MLNALANHGYLPRSGMNITLEDLLISFDESVNLAAEVVTGVGNAALTTSTTGNSSTFHLADTVKHNVLEHDGSLSRNDAHFGDALHFDPAIWATVVAYFTEATIPVETAARARTDRVAAAAASNLAFDLTKSGAGGSIAETALYQIILGDPIEGNPPTEWVKILFGK